MKHAPVAGSLAPRVDLQSIVISLCYGCQQSERKMEGEGEGWRGRARVREREREKKGERGEGDMNTI